MGKAEDAARRNLRARQEDSEAEEAAKARADAEAKKALYSQIDAEIPGAMKRLEQKDFPGVQLFRTGGRFSKRESAYWTVRVGTWAGGRTHGPNDPKLAAVHSDGTISWAYGKDSIRNVLQVQELQLLLEGIKQLGR